MGQRTGNRRAVEIGAAAAMISAPVVHTPLSDQYFAEAIATMRCCGVSHLYFSRLWDSLRHYNPSYWHTVLEALRNDPATAHYFRQR